MVNSIVRAVLERAAHLHDAHSVENLVPICAGLRLTEPLSKHGRHLDNC